MRGYRHLLHLSECITVGARHLVKLLVLGRHEPIQATKRWRLHVWPDLFEDQVAVRAAPLTTACIHGVIHCGCGWTRMAAGGPSGCWLGVHH